METEAKPTDTDQRLRQHGKGSELFVIFIVNVLLKLVTLGIYHFWAKTRVRRYLWSQASFDNERFEYRGRGIELFLGFLKALGVLILIGLASVALLEGAKQIHEYLPVVVIVGLYVGFFMLIGVGIYSARRYTLSRTRWRSIRFGQSGSSLIYARKMLGSLLLTLVTLGLYAPFMHNRLTGYVLNNTAFGSERVVYDGRGRDLFGRFLLSYLLTIPSLGLVWFWYKAAELRYTADHTRFQTLSFGFEATGGQLFWLMLGNLFMLVVTLGLAFPWVVLRNIRFVFRHMEIYGELDYAAIAQGSEVVPSTGEGLVEVFGMGGI